MITLTKLNGREIVVNAELIESLEATPDTVVNLVTGNRLVVKNSVEDIVARVIVYRKKINADKKIPNSIEGFKRKSPPAPGA